MTARSRPRHRARRGQRLALWLVAFAVLGGAAWFAVLAGGDAAVAVHLRPPADMGDRVAADEPVDDAQRGAANGSGDGAAATVPPDPDLERRIAEDVAAFINSERRARSLPLLGLVDGEQARAANEARLRDQQPDPDLLGTYAAARAEALHARLGTGTRSGEAVAGWLATEEAEVLLDRDATGIAVAAACQPGERGGDLVVTVHVLQTGAVPDDVAPPITDERPGAGRGEACQFADLATGPTAEQSVLAPAALAAAGAVMLALVALEIQRRRHRLGLTAAPVPIDPEDPDDRDTD